MTASPGLPFGYLQLLLLACAALVGLLLLFLLRRKQITHISPLQRAISQSKHSLAPEQLDLFLPLLVLEEQFPAFGRIIGIVIERRGLKELLRLDSFCEPAAYLARAAFSEQERENVGGALCHIVRGLLENPDIEYGCRPELSGLIDDFIQEMHLNENVQPATDSQSQPRE